ncbi:MAG: HAD hydrolase-like protein [Candidatus Saccharimonadales bacterium]|nr:HAD hydrolase-like protein [Candidatus Saccharimonadales bacterium]
MKYQVALFDADGVLIVPEHHFSTIYARQHGLADDHFQKFFKSEGFVKCMTGDKDLRDLILEYKDLWMIKDPDALIQQWFEAENAVNKELVEFIQTLRSKGLPCYLATTQEKHRGAYIKETMLKDKLDGFFISSEFGYKKPDPKYFQHIIDDLTGQGLINNAGQVFFADDDQTNVEEAKKQGIDAILYRKMSDVVGRFS